MALKQDNSVSSELQKYHLDNPDFLHGSVSSVLQQFIDSELEEHLSAGHYERTDSRKGYRNGSYPRNEKALVLSLMEMHLMGVSTRKVNHHSMVFAATIAQ